MPQEADDRRLDPLLTPDQAAEFLSIAPSTLYEYVAANALPYVLVRQGRRKRTIRFERGTLMRWLQSRRVAFEAEPGEKP
jgi:excisionase family DNA binding protein